MEKLVLYGMPEFEEPINTYPSTDVGLKLDTNRFNVFELITVIRNCLEEIVMHTDSIYKKGGIYRPKAEAKASGKKLRIITHVVEDGKLKDFDLGEVTVNEKDHSDIRINFHYHPHVTINPNLLGHLWGLAYK